MQVESVIYKGTPAVNTDGVSLSHHIHYEAGAQEARYNVWRQASLCHHVRDTTELMEQSSTFAEFQLSRVLLHC